MVDRKRVSRPSSIREQLQAERRSSDTPDEDVDLFRDAVRGAVPIAREHRVVIDARAAPPLPVQTILDDYDALDELRRVRVTAESALDTGEEPSYIREGFSPMLLRRLRRGHWVPERELDLHGATREQARELLATFLKECVRRRARCVRVIHGKGLGSKNREPVLKAKVRVWLAHRDEVLAYCQTPPTMGGSGAMLVLLKA